MLTELVKGELTRATGLAIKQRERERERERRRLCDDNLILCSSFKTGFSSIFLFEFQVVRRSSVHCICYKGKEGLLTLNVKFCNGERMLKDKHHYLIRVLNNAYCQSMAIILN
jgi:hypothetical protein